MKEKIIQINSSIEEKRNRLKEKVDRYFASIRTLSSESSPQQSLVTNKNNSVPPISYILYGFAGLSVIGTLATNSKLLCLGIAAVSAFGGYKLSKQNSCTPHSINTPTNSNIATIKNDVTSKILDSVKRITSEWEEFMEQNQKEIQNVISASSLSDSEKDTLISQVFIYEVIDISISEFSSMINSVSNTAELKQKMALYKSKLINAIDIAADKQIKKYKNLTNSI